jgi:hypothetical protein
MEWKGKRPVIMVSTYHDTSMKVSTIKKGGQQKGIMKLVCVLDYTKNMGGVDRNYHYCATYSFVWKSLKWCRKLLFWCLEVSIVNALIIESVSAGCPTFQLVITLWPWWYVKRKCTRCAKCRSFLPTAEDGVVVALNGFL